MRVIFDEELKAVADDLDHAADRFLQILKLVGDVQLIGSFMGFHHDNTKDLRHWVHRLAAPPSAPTSG